MAETNPANFANLPKEKVQEIASKRLSLSMSRLANEVRGMGGKVSHGSEENDANNKTDENKEVRVKGSQQRLLGCC